MRKIVLSLAAAGAALAVASPAAAQYYPQPQQYGYGSGYGYNAYGRGNWGEARSLQARIDAVQYRIRVLDRRDAIGDRSADRLRDEAGRLESRFHRAMRYGLDGYEASNIEAQLAQLERRVQFVTQYRYGRYDRGEDGYRDHDGYRDQDGNRDHDGYRD